MREATRSVCCHPFFHPNWPQDKMVATTMEQRSIKRKEGWSEGQKPLHVTSRGKGWMLNMKQPTYPRAKIWAPGTPAGSWDDATFFMYLLRSSMAPWILSFKHSCLSSCITQCFPTCALMHLQSTALTTVNRPVD